MLLGLHTYSLNLHGVGQAWDADFKLPWPRQLTTFELFDKIVALGLDGVHLDDGVLENLEESFLKEVGAAARERGLYLEYNFSLDLGGMGIGIQHDLEEAIAISQALGSDIVKMSMDLIRPRPVAASRFHPDVMKQLQDVVKLLKSAVPGAKDAGIRIAVENHCDSFSEEILWLLDEVGSPQVGACIDTANAFHVTEDPMTAIRNLAPRAFTNHFRDDRIDFKRDGFRFTGTSIGEGDLDMKGAYQIIKTQSAMNRINIETDLDIPLDNMETALGMEVDAIKRSVLFCREVLGICFLNQDGHCHPES
ncbi:MAG: sugar phosphate isomerase/epimerase [Deltaproteobacteria bacterium]|jgi:3-oxoisoapionate decarboxylase|nr:sugar phosphate isomerase/epimerase [Deltaproteobacteria bacterium]MBT4266545.1 sugar phosphate isomerase/epimerase [Deltaproteobacteria bacterium]MBT4643538.1 sugar phosphate isomerase/epimerase [Deltaproteobacteria bacterium]MBT6500910.1 sugar phosphate isomerase/epimerase [Deltaproteobacteria bacterium]MBT7154030.1 sugar phosphate isomerase/epimerase [Deltaproteobacteria bacterium]